MSLSVLGFRFCCLSDRNPPSLRLSAIHCRSVSVSSSPFARRARVGRPAGERFYRRCNEGVHDGLDSGARAMLSCNRSRAYGFPDDLEALRGDWRRFTARHDSGGARVRDLAPRPRLVAPMRDLRGLAQMAVSSGFFVRLQGLPRTTLRARMNIISASLGPKD